MPHSTTPLLTAEDVEAQFYRALASADLTMMMACWSDDDEVSCVPPGGEMLRGLAAVRALFSDLFERGPVDVQVEDVHTHAGVMHAIHTLVEVVQISTEQGPAHAQVFTTNVYVKTPRGWRMQAHHASPGRVSSSPPESRHQPTLH
jgi:ketosteroid isomerase-like protein